ncbi:MAG: tetraacyldisaccharide 4'-kinase [Alphaproteobacteria bacterium]|nr:tetraacyldisaccharide 4'-kinase [Alphaproteobacteria bacterium]
MKAPAFWSNPFSRRARFLTPLSYLYRAGGVFRALKARPYEARVPVLCVGNIVAGGAGKTPVALALYRLLSKKRPKAKMAFAAYGYGSDKPFKGPVRVDLSLHNAHDVGDEALLLAQHGPCWVGAARADVVRAAAREASLIIMDDGLQNPHIKPTLNLLVIDGAAGFGNERVIPAGPLRETLAHALPRLDAAILIGEDEHHIAPRIAKPFFKASLLPALPADFLTRPDVYAFAGIGRPEKFYDSCRQAGLNIIQLAAFPDHHIFTEEEILTLHQEAADMKLRLVTTAKDFVRIPPALQQGISVLDISLVFEDPEGLLSLITEKIRHDFEPKVKKTA